MKNKEVKIASEKEIQKLRLLTKPLLEWYWQNARVLPWRIDTTPYRVWVSEIMLQQTRVDAVIPYYLRFLERLPSVLDLACINGEELLKLWEGLGYYNRVRNMQKTAKILVEEYKGQFPEAYEELKSLPGIGDYTAGAIASIAFGIPVPAVDGNVYRVLARLLSCDQDIAIGTIKKAFFLVANAILPADCPGDFNQAMMELGATICLPNTIPKCGLCPISHGCKAYRKGCADSLPYKASKKPRRIEQRTVFVFLCEGNVLLQKRRNKGLLAQMWQFPNILGKLNKQEVEQYLQEHSIEAGLVLKLDEAKHIFSHIEWHMIGYQVQIKECITCFNDAKWIKTHAMNQHALPSAFHYYKNSII